MYDIWFGVLLAFGCIDVDLWDGSDLKDRLDLGAKCRKGFL